MQPPIVDKANTSKRLSKGDSLLTGRIEPKFVCSLRLLAHGLLAFLTLDILLHNSQGSSSHRRDKIAIGPQGRQFALQDRKLLAQEATTSAFDQTYQPMDTELGVTLHQQMHVIGHDLQTHHGCLMFLAHFTNDGCQPFCYPFHEHLAAVFGTPDHMILAGIEHIPVGLVGNPAHEDNIQQQAVYCQVSPSPRPKKEHALYPSA